MPESRYSLIPLLFILFVTGIYAGYALMPQAQVPLNETALIQRIGALESQVASLQSYLNDLHNRNSTILSLNDVYESVRVSIVTVSGLLATSDIFGRTAYTTVIGSGFVVNLTGEPLIVTNYHVVNGIINGSVTFLDGEAYPFEIVGLDKYSDLAVIRAYAPSDKLVPLTVVSSSGLRVGDTVIAIGNPYGLESTMTSGIVSQLNRTIQTETAGNYSIAGIIQITTPINPGNSGGPLLDSQGNVVGVTTAIISGSQNVGFAVPSDTILREFSTLVERGEYVHPYIGITGYSLNYAASTALGINQTWGVLVQTVVAGGPADSAGIKGGSRVVSVGGEQIRSGGDVIIMIDGMKIKNMDDLSSYLLTRSPGQVVSMTVIRGTSCMDIQVVLGARP
ncbi:MAG: trypsin-like peptidase domain-containing protein [Candidatus Verstraetearchaeota archaeon]|nr:trypsin-like peptidase domain-containing protein [Candidatus Verstraetearchaeota archaeon]